MKTGPLSVLRAIIKREYLQRVRSRWFVISTIGAPLVVIGVMVVPLLMAQGGGESSGPRSMALLDRSGSLGELVGPGLEGAGYRVSRASGGSEEDLATLTQQVEDGDLYAVLVLDSATLNTGSARLIVENSPSSIRRLTLRQLVGQAALVATLQGEAPEAMGLLSGGSLEVEVLDDEVEVESSDFILAYIGAFLLYITLLFYAVAVMRSVLEEKTSRVVEVVLSSVRPIELMLGKILGVGAVGLTQLGIWATIFLLFAELGLPKLMGARPELAGLVELANVAPTAGQLGLFLAFFLGGYFLYSSMYAAVGAMTNSDQEAQQAQGPLVMLMVVPAVILPPVLENPESGLAVWTSLVPFFAPVLMFARAVSGAAPAIQIVISLVGILVATVAMAWVGGRIYRVGILMTGKRPTIRELWRWVRAG